MEPLTAAGLLPGHENRHEGGQKNGPGSREENVLFGTTDLVSPVTFKPVVARLLLHRLETECEAYCMLTGYDELPENFDTDIDFMVGPRDFERVPGMLAEIARDTGSRLFQVIPHEVSGRAYLLTLQTGTDVSLVQPDSASDYRHFGRLWLRAEEILAERRWHPQGFWIPGAAHEFTYYLIKRLNKRELKKEQGSRLARLYAEDPQRAATLLGRFFGKTSTQKLIAMAADGRWEALIRNMEAFRSELRRRSVENFSQTLRSSALRLQHAGDRILRPTGGWIAFMGPDGCGKSSVIEAVSTEFAPAYRGVLRFHMRPNFLKVRAGERAPVVDPHGKPPRGFFMSIVKGIYMASDYFAGYLARIRPAMMRTHLVISDRYFYDILVDSKRIRYGGPGWLLRLIGRIIPRPELTLLLNAPPEVLWSRKQEVPFEEVVRQQKAYLELAGRLKSVVVIDAAQPLETVIQQSLAAIIAHFSQRTMCRLGVPARLGAPAGSEQG
jgi:thymidylate kinase